LIMAYDVDYAQSYDDFNRGKDYVSEVDFLEKIFENFNKKPVKILDLGCGTGLHDIVLKQRGYKVTGLDLSKQMIDLAANRGDGMRFVVGDMSDFNLDEKFDVIICMFSSLGYVVEDEKLKSFFKCCREHLNPGGLLIFDVWNGDGVLNLRPEERQKVIEEDDLRIIRTSHPNLDEYKHVNNIKFDIKVYAFDYEENHIVRYFFVDELKEFMEKESFEFLCSCPSYEVDKEVTDEDWNMVMVGRLR
jgi:SAM-dependent methyltransferase